MPRDVPLTVQLIDCCGDARTVARRVIQADGVITQEEQALLRRLDELAALAERADEGRLNAISMLDFGELKPRRRRRMREMGEPLEALETDDGAQVSAA